MCGFAGVINGAHVIHHQQLASVARQVSFRGPDSCGIRIMNEQWLPAEEGTTALFFNRLAVIDLDERSNQPFEDDRYLLMFNGEIYNYRSLKQQLESEGILFKTTSDTEVLFYALRQWGNQTLSRLNGMFAFCWIDKQKKKFLIARDRLGIKPLYYRQQGSSFSFGSELYSILRLTKDKGAISSRAVNMYLWMQFVPTPYSIIEDVFKLPPGCYIEGSVDQLIKQVPLQPIPYWEAYAFVNRQREAMPSVNIEEILKNSLERQLHSDVPLGLFLSSGIDSSLLVALVNKYFARNAEVKLFTVAFEEKTFRDESAKATAFAGGFHNPNLRTHQLKVEPQYLQMHLESMYQYFDEPFGDPASLLNWMISKKAREYVTVAISGDGADELFWGYPRYNRWRQFGNWNNIPLLPGLVRKGAGLLPASRLKHNLLFVTQHDAIQRHFDLFLPSGQRFNIRNSMLKNRLWATEGAAAIGNRSDLPAVLDIKTYLPDAMLYKVDRASMAASIEVRVPYLDNEVLECALQMALEKKSNKLYTNKAILKELLLRLAPHYNINRPKIGFGFPLEKWLREEWKDLVLASINKESLMDVGLSPSVYMKLVNDFYTKQTPYFTDVWYVFNLMLWLENYRRFKFLN